MLTSLGAHRRDRLRALSASLGLDGALVFASRRSQLAFFAGYRPGFLSNWGALWVGREDDHLAVAFGFDAERASHVSGLTAVAASRPAELVPEGVRRIGLVTRDLAVDECPPSLLEELGARGITWQDLAEPVIEWRSIPDDSELAAARAAARLCDEAFRELRARPDSWAADWSVVGLVEGVARSRGAAQALCLVGLGRGAVVTEPQGRPRRPGDLISCEVTLAVDSMWTQANWTFAPDGLSTDDRRGLAACRDARSRMIQEIRPGVTARAVFREGELALEDHGLAQWVEYDFGHGVGAHTPELPRLTRASADVVCAGNIVAVHAAVRDPEGPTWFLGGPVRVDDGGAQELVPDAVWLETEDGVA